MTTENEIKITEYRYLQLIAAEKMQAQLIQKFLYISAKHAIAENAEDVAARALEILKEWDVPFKYWRGTLDKSRLIAHDVATNVIEIWT